MVIFVMGGAGYIGSHACKALARAGHEPVVFDNLSTGHRELMRWGPLVVGDVADRGAARAALAASRAEAVMHFAASAYVGVSIADRGGKF
jgi:UDP-arabinose 4-epimerase